MRSPFPGMDPYLEQFWQDVHSRLVLYAADQLESQLPDNLACRVEERIALEAEGMKPRSAYPDVKIAERGGRGGAAGVRSSAAVMEPIIVEYDEPATETFINIVEAGPGQRLVTVIEVLSLSNKLPGEGQNQYRQKQRELAGAGVSLVEIDLLRRGQRVLSVPASMLPPQAETTYLACVRRGGRSRFELYPMPLRSALPAIRIPLRETDDDIRLDLQAVVEQAYRKGRYHLSVHYAKPPEPRLAGADARWAQALLKKTRRK